MANRAALCTDISISKKLGIKMNKDLISKRIGCNKAHKLQTWTWIKQSQKGKFPYIVTFIYLAPFSISSPRLLQRLQTISCHFTFIPLMKLLIYMLTIECLHGFNIKSKGFVNVHKKVYRAYQ